MHQQDRMDDLGGGKVGLGSSAIAIENAAHKLRKLGDALRPLLLAVRGTVAIP